MSSADITRGPAKIPVDLIPVILEIVTDPSVYVDVRGVIVAAGRRLAEAFGHEASDLIGRSLCTIVPTGTPGDGPIESYDEFPWCCRGRKAIGGGRYHVGRRRDGSEFPVEVSATAVEAGGCAGGYLVFLRDMTSVERALEEGELLKSSFLESPLESITMDHEGRVLEFNHAAEKTFGFKRADVIGRDLSEFIIPPGYRAAHREGLARVVATRQGRVLGKRLELTGMRADGTEIPVELTIESLAGREPPVFTGYVRDISERKRLQEQLVTQEKLASLGTLTAGIAHEIKNPLNFVNNFAVLIVEMVDELKDALSACRDCIDPDNRQDIEELIGNIRESAGKVANHGKRADSIVKGMLLHARSGAGEPQPTDLNSLAAEYLNLAYHGMRATDRSFEARMETDFDASLGPVRVVPQDLSRVILNLVNNAFYATHKKRKAGSDESYMPTVSLRTRDLGDRIELAVRDNGPGIDQAHIDKIFEPFFTTKPTGEGTGLGLSLSYDIVVRVHGGQMSVETRPGELTEFRIVLPKEGAARQGGAK